VDGTCRLVFFSFFILLIIIFRPLWCGGAWSFSSRLISQCLKLKKLLSL
jgi:hypothetical protein